MALWSPNQINQSKKITSSGTVNLNIPGIYEIIIRGGSGKGASGSGSIIRLGAGGGGGAYAYFKLNIGNNRENNKVITTFSNDKISTVKIWTDNPTIWRATYTITSGENGKDFNLTNIPSGDELPNGGAVSYTQASDDILGDGALISYKFINGEKPSDFTIEYGDFAYSIPAKGGASNGFPGGNGRVSYKNILQGTEEIIQ